ncbi:hypothetical protein [Luteibacter yeojuensis]|uniref:DUF2188 domain-containing protein n=1 Tax=Luteibacter yeojuensis TaxID=345309 RepID=A0A7X5QSX5_9GAMM|nr:hypothetical protein [Luteibacter yeojuensis]NID14816.1 hypothetical protein [Luteibacter yeojuensis]
MQRMILYVPFNASSRGQWTLRRNAELVGQFPTRDEAIRHALALTAAMRNQQGQPAEIKVEDESGVWRLADIDGADADEGTGSEVN